MIYIVNSVDNLATIEDATWNRIVVVPFVTHFTNEPKFPNDRKKDIYLSSKLKRYAGSNDYINATKMCKDANKRFKNWLQNQSSKDLINQLEASASFQANGPANEKSITGGNNSALRGTYVHRKLIGHIASWASPTFALKVSDIVEEYILREEKMKHRVVVHRR